MQPTESTQQVQPVQTQPVARQMIAPTQAPESADTSSTTSKSSWFPFRLRGGAGPCCEMLACCLCCCALEDICCCGLEELC